MNERRIPEQKTLPLGKNLFWGVSGNVVFAATQWLVLIALARLGSPEDVGMLTIVTALITPIFVFGDLAMNDAHTVDDLSEFRRADYFALRLVGALCAASASVVVSFMWFGAEAALVGAALAFIVVKFIGSQMQLNHGIFQREQRVDLLARSNVTRGIIGCLVFALVFGATGELWVALLGQALVWAFVLGRLDRSFLGQVGVSDRFTSVLSTNRRTLGRLLLWLLPLALTALLVNATISVPRLALGATADLAAVGVFGAIAFIDTGFGVAINAIGFASASRLRAAIRQGKRRKFVALSLVLMALTTAIGGTLFLVGYLFGEEILTVLYGAEYVDMAVFVVIIASTALRSVFAPLQVALTAGHVLWRRFFINVAAFTATFAAALLLVPEQGAFGAAVAFMVGIITRCVLLVVFFVRLVWTMQTAGGADHQLSGS
ncbi:MAG: lipopolysaccharide biosynthesis protein [Pseudomonadota bacterium]